jgi:hypothetical protein
MTSAITGLDSLRAGRYLHIALIGLLFVIFNILLMKVSRVKTTWWIANVLLLFSIPLTVFLMFWSEGLFMVLLLTFILIFIQWTELKKIHLLIISAVIAGIMLMTRYAAAGLIGGIFIYLLFFHKTNLKERLLNFLLFLAVLILTVMPWIIYTLVAGNGKSIRAFAFHPFSLSDLKDLTINLISWLFPESFGITDYFLPVLVIIILGVIILQVFRTGGLKKQFSVFLSSNKNFLFLMLLISVSYIVFLLISITFFDAHTRLNNRILAPLFLTGLLFFIPFLNWLFTVKRIKVTGFILILVIIPGMSAYSFQLWYGHHLKGSGYTSKSWNESETLEKIEAYSGYAFYSNGNDLIRLYYPDKSNAVKSLPIWRSPNTLEENKTFNTNLLEMRQHILDRNYVLIYFEKITWRDYFVGKEALLDLLKDFQIEQLKDGFIIRSVK